MANSTENLQRHFSESNIEIGFCVPFPIMKTLFAAAICSLLTLQAVPAQGVAFSKPEFVSHSVGYLDTTIRRFSYRGSATVVRDPRLVYSCAHNFYDRGEWASDYTFYRGIHQRRLPSNSQGAEPRGFHYFTKYARAARFTNGESNKSFASDFVVLYGNSSFGPAARIQERSAKLLRSNRSKRIIGYPADVDFSGNNGFYFQHSTGWFNNKARRIKGPFQEFFNVSTGPGNSGGSIFLRDRAGGADLFAGVLVSGSRRSAGVVSMNGASRRLADRALGSVTTPFRTTNSNRIKLSESRPSATRRLPVRDTDGPVENLKLTLQFSNSGASEPLVWLKSPSGTVKRVSVSGTSDLSESFGGCESAGDWQLQIQSTKGLPTTFVRASLQGTAHDAE